MDGKTMAWPWFIYLVYMQPFRTTTSRVAFAYIVMGDCITDELKDKVRTVSCDA